jgi:hypothetical protein
MEKNKYGLCFELETWDKIVVALEHYKKIMDNFGLRAYSDPLPYIIQTIKYELKNLVNKKKN